MLVGEKRGGEAYRKALLLMFGNALARPDSRTLRIVTFCIQALTLGVHISS